MSLSGTQGEKELIKTVEKSSWNAGTASSQRLCSKNTDENYPFFSATLLLRRICQDHSRVLYKDRQKRRPNTL